MIREASHHPSTVRHVPRRWSTGLAILTLGAVACGRDTTLTVRAGDRPANPDPATSPAQAGAHSLLAAGVAIDRLQIVLRDFRLQTSQNTAGTPSPDDARIGPAIVLVDLMGPQLDPGAMTEIVPAELVRWASFYQSVITLSPASQDEVAANPALAPLLGRTLVITGRVPGGAPFTYESSVAAVLVRPATYRMGLNHNNVTINIAPNMWFQGPNGEPLDPRDPAIAPTIESNILESIDAYMDDNRDGKPDSLG